LYLSRSVAGHCLSVVQLYLKRHELQQFTRAYDSNSAKLIDREMPLVASHKELDFPRQ